MDILEYQVLKEFCEYLELCKLAKENDYEILPARGHNKPEYTVRKKNK